MFASAWLVALSLAAGPAAAPQPPLPLPPDDATTPILRPPPAGVEIETSIAAGDYARAARLLAAAIARAPEDRALLVRIAGVFTLDRRPLNAAVALKKAEMLAPLDAYERLQLVLAYVAMGRDDWARPELARLAGERPDDVVPTYWLARLDYNAGLYASAIARLETVIARQPDFARAHDNLGLCLEALNEPERAIAHYRAAVRLTRDEAPPSPWPAVNLATLLRTRGELEEARALLEEALRHDASLAQAHYQMGLLLEQGGELEPAAAALRRAAEADPQFAEPLYVLARVVRRLGRQADADAALAAFERRRTSAEQEAPPR